MVASDIVSLDEARAIRRKSPEALNPRFIVQQGGPGERRVVSYETGRPVNDAVYTDADGSAPFDLRDRLNAKAATDARLARMPRRVLAGVFFESAEAQRMLADLLVAYTPGGSEAFDDLVEEFDRAYTEAVGR